MSKHNNHYRSWISAGVAAAFFACTLLVTMAGLAAPGKSGPTQMEADVLEYDAAKGIITARGNVRITQPNAVITGAEAQFNTKTQEGYVTGGVNAVKEDMTLTAAEVRSLGNNHLSATGNVIMTKKDGSLRGPQVDYYEDRQYALATGGAELTNADSVMTADRIEAFFAEDRALGEGNVHVSSEVRKLDAYAEHAVYSGPKLTKASGKLVLTGNPRAYQEGNFLTGDVLTLFMDDKAAQVQGRTKLIINPQ